MEVRRTVPVKLDVDSDDAALLEDNVEFDISDVVTCHDIEWFEDQHRLFKQDG